MFVNKNMYTVGIIMPFHVYILECADKSLYIGSTNDLERRLHSHNNSKNGAHYTKIRRPVTLAYAEECASLGAARSREAALKRLKRDQKLELIKSVAENR